MAKVLPGVRTLALIGKRIYAFVLVAVLLYVFYLAISYLVVMVFYPAPVPERMLASPGLLGAEQLRTEVIPGAPAPQPRPPMAHYHELGAPLPADRSNGCTLSGCHEPLPHSRSVYVRAFANLHSTFLACQVCHEPVKQHPVQAGWASLVSGLQVDPPALVQLMNMFQTQRARIEADPAGHNGQILSLLAEVVRISQDPALRFLYLEISTTEAGSPVWRDAVVRLDEQMTNHTRGEYGAKIAILPTPDSYVRQSEPSRRAAETTEPAERKRLTDQLHATLLARPDRCTACHGDTPPLIDFASLGYAPQRTEFLGSNPVAHEVQSIREGRQFYLPSMTEERR